MRLLPLKLFFSLLVGTFAYSDTYIDPNYMIYYNKSCPSFIADSFTKQCIATGSGGGGVTSVTASNGLLSSGGATPNISPNVVTFGMNDNQISAYTIITTPVSNAAILIQYQVTRNGQVSMGEMRIVNNGTTANIGQGNITQTANIGVQFSVTVTGGNVLLQYKSTSTGHAPTMKYTEVIYE